MPDLFTGDHDASNSRFSPSKILRVAAPGLVALFGAACGNGEVAPVVTPDIGAIVSPVPTDLIPSATAELPPEPTATPGLFSDYMPAYSPQDQAWVFVNPNKDVAASWNTEEKKWNYDFETIAQDERINIFDANSFPDKFREIAKNWLTATDEEWTMYQEFVEASRAEFFEKEGIADEVAAMTGINESLRSLWGMIYYVQTNRAQAIADQLMPVVTPLELRIILENEPLFESWVERQETDMGRKIFIYGFRALAVGNSDDPTTYSSHNYGSILGREDFRTPRNPVVGIDGGDLALLARLFPDDPNTLVTIISMKTPQDGSFPQTHALYAQAYVFDENYFLPAGTLCHASRAGEIYRAQPLPVDFQLNGNLGPMEDFINNLGANLGYGHGELNVDGKGLDVRACLHPQTGLEIVMGIFNYTINTGRTSAIWPWQQQVAPTATP